LANPDEKRDRVSRMADFAVWIARARPVLGWHRSKFSDAYEANRGTAGDAVIQSDRIAQAILDLREREHGHWEGSATDLTAALPVSEALRKQKSFPALNKMPERLTRLQDTLAGVGVDIAFDRARDRSRKKIIVLTRREDQPTM
jgi:hypothetical protein